ncbi:hypothetical protein LCM20_07695 [Halobacillus litoralis]|uniref:hypothetical protein n=1 Tax=Halobacillus litoralis TaxID=45668 RepID=UPI001CD5CA99|nr:hypothetical protein [Halobacillus litoralis]MCA0970464.1 hypothetical protein [Halobacillus litoralis]
MSSNTKTLGLISAPGYPDKLGDVLGKELPELLQYYVDDAYEWKVEYHVRSIAGATDDSEEVLEAARKEKEECGWDMAVALTDLPLFHDNKALIAEAFKNGCVALISLPGLGSTPMVKRVRESVLQLVNEMYYGSSSEQREYADQRLKLKGQNKYPSVKNKSSTSLMGKRIIERLSPIQRETEEDDSETNVYFTVTTRISGAIRHVTGMVRANRPWSMFPAFLKLIVIAFTTGAYALVFPTLWMLSDHYAIWRLSLLTLVSITSMVAWIILAHNLWENRRTSYQGVHLRRLYNMVTLCTLVISVTLYYVMLFFIFFLAVFLLIPMGLLEIQLNGDVNYIQYLYIAWTVTSVSTIIGALGSALENEEVVLSSTYGYRHRQRYEQIKEVRQNQEKTVDDQDNVKKTS